MNQSVTDSDIGKREDVMYSYYRITSFLPWYCDAMQSTVLLRQIVRLSVHYTLCYRGHID